MNNLDHKRKWEFHGYQHDPKRKRRLQNEDAISDRMLNILDFILKNGYTYQQELAEKFKDSYTTLSYPLGKLYHQGVIRRVPGTDKYGRLIQRIILAIDEEELKRILKIFKKARKDIKKGISLLEESIDKYYDELKQPTMRESFRIERKS